MMLIIIKISEHMKQLKSAVLYGLLNLTQLINNKRIRI
jgi:hypothetical protein